MAFHSLKPSSTMRIPSFAPLLCCLLLPFSMTAHAATSPPATASASQGLGLTTMQLIDGLQPQKREDSRLASGEPREMITFSKISVLEVIGPARNVSRWSLMFGMPNDDNQAAMLSYMTATVTLANTFPSWRGDADNPGKWLVAAVKQLGKNIDKNRNDPAPVLKSRDGRTIKLQILPALGGMMILTVKPK